MHKVTPLNDVACVAFGLKARTIPAWGNAPGGRIIFRRGLKARTMRLPIPNVSFVALDSGTLEQPAKLVLKGLLRVVGLLGIDIGRQRKEVGRPDGEDAVTPLPCEVLEHRRLGLQPLRGAGFQLLKQLGDCNGSRETDCKMHVVANSAYAIAFAAGVTNDRCEIGMEICSNGVGQGRLAVFRAEDYMDQDETESLGHGEDYSAGLQPLIPWAARTWGAAPGWYRARLRRSLGAHALKLPRCVQTSLDCSLSGTQVVAC